MENEEKTETVLFVEKAAKAVWAFITAFALSVVSVITPVLISGRWPETADWLVALGYGLIGGFGVGTTVYNVRNKDSVG